VQKAWRIVVGGGGAEKNTKQKWEGHEPRADDNINICYDFRQKCENKRFAVFGPNSMKCK